MRWHIIAILWYKEALRHLAQPGGIILAVLLVAASVLLSFFGRTEQQSGGGLVGDVQHCFIDYWEDGPWIDHLRQTVPTAMEQQVVFRHASRAPVVQGRVVYPAACGAIQVRTLGKDEAGRPRYQVWFWAPGPSLAPFEAWFWEETNRHFQSGAAVALDRLDPDARRGGLLPNLAVEHSHLEGTLDTRSALATALVLFALFFVCVYLLPSLTCEERERGVLLAQALSPASPLEILIAKMLFYPIIGIALAALLAGIANPAVLLDRFFWLALVVASVGSLGIGLTLASLARTQRAASMGAMTYTLAIGLVLFICKQNNIPGLPYLFLEYYGPRMLHAALSQTVQWFHWANLAAAAVLALCWNVLAVILFRRCGWQ